MIDVVFISDLHLHPENQAVLDRFNQFLVWARQNVKTIYILGDFFHAWPGDDAMDEWSEGIAHQLFALKKQGITLFYMQGNRDFLLGNVFALRAGWTLLSEPAVIQLGQEKTLLVHGDRYCTKDLAHQRFRLLTRNKLFSSLFLRIPLKYRKQLVAHVRHRSEMNHSKTLDEMDVVDEVLIRHMLDCGVTQLIHGHTHRPGTIMYRHFVQKSKRCSHLMTELNLNRFVLSDWDDRPFFLCYHNTKGFYFTHM